MVGENLIVLSEQYKSLKSNPAFQHYQGMIWHIKNQMENGILQGVTDNGKDVTQSYRAMYGVILQILAIPGQIERQTIATEYQAYLRDLEEDAAV